MPKYQIKLIQMCLHDKEFAIDFLTTKLSILFNSIFRILGISQGSLVCLFLAFQ